MAWSISSSAGWISLRLDLGGRLVKVLEDRVRERLALVDDGRPQPSQGQDALGRRALGHGASARALAFEDVMQAGGHRRIDAHPREAMSAFQMMPGGSRPPSIWW